jgi:hypothetical protein
MSDTVLKDCAEDIPHLQVKILKEFLSKMILIPRLYRKKILVCKII